MDLVPLMDIVGEPATAAIIGLVSGGTFGALALVSGFCTRSAALDISRRRGGDALMLWVIAFAIAVSGTQLLVSYEAVDIEASRFYATSLSLSGAIIGGLLFGVGMALARGCASRLLVLGASGNMRALIATLVIGLTAWATINGGLAGARNWLSAFLSTNDIGTNSLASLLGTSGLGGILAAAVLAAAAGGTAIKRPSPVRVAQGVMIGSLIPLTWWLTTSLSRQAFEPVQPESLSFIRPLSAGVDLLASNESLLGLDTGMLAGTILGALLAAIVTRRFKLRGFREDGAAHPARYFTGAILMGFGGVMAGGCTVGAGFSGGSVLAVTSLVALAGMFIGAMVTDALVEKAPAAQSSGALQPAE